LYTNNAKKLQVKDAIQASLRYHPKETNVYFVGSLSRDGRVSFNPKLSDVDLLITASCDTLEEYAKYFREIEELNSKFRNKKDVYDIFFISDSILDSYLSTLSIIWDNNLINEENLIFGSGERRVSTKGTIPNQRTVHQLYIAKSLDFCVEYARKMPFADSKQARKVAKSLLKGLKLLICAHTSPPRLRQVENELQMLMTFEEVVPVLCRSLKREFHLNKKFDKVLGEGFVEDWPTWMAMQNEAVDQLAHLIPSLYKVSTEQQLHMALCMLWDMLTLDLKEIMWEADREHQKNQIMEFADTTAGLVAKLALGGVQALVDFDDQDTPTKVRQSYEIMVEHLGHNDTPTLKCLAASVILLEYAFSQGILHANAVN
jgi:predicted nucleotidyltransferase